MELELIVLISLVGLAIIGFIWQGLEVTFKKCPHCGGKLSSRLTSNICEKCGREV